MSSRTIQISVAVFGIWLGCSSPAGAHRLDEYLQATLVSIDRDRVSLEIALTPGVQLAAQTFGSIDTDGDGRISVAEGDRYARQVLSCLVLSVDGRRAPLVLQGREFPEFDEMKVGVGTIRVRASATAAGTAGRHQLSYLNTHRPESSVYLVNSLIPADHRVHIGGQQRDRAQRTLTVDYTVTSDAWWAQASWLLAALGTVGVLALARRAWKPERWATSPAL